jgi:hypothetical protein
LNIVLVAAYFPPKKHIASGRMLAYATALASVSSVTVITLGQHRGTLRYFDASKGLSIVSIGDGSVLSCFLRCLNIFPTVSHFLSTVANIVFAKLSLSLLPNWQRRAEAELAALLRSHRVDVIIASCGPVEACLAAYNSITHENHGAIKLVLDMRDELSQRPGISKSQRQRYLAIESKLSKRADLVIGVSAPQLDQLKKSFVSCNSFLEVRNGFCHEIPVPTYAKRDRLRLGYFGTFYGRAKPCYIFTALTQLGPLPIDFYISSPFHNFRIPKVLRSRVFLLGYTSYEEAIGNMQDMDVNLLLLPNRGRKGVFSGKLYDYISAGRSILCLSDHYDVADSLIASLGCGYSSLLSDEASIAASIHRIFLDWERNSLRMPEASAINAYHRSQQVSKLVDWILAN